MRNNKLTTALLLGIAIFSVSCAKKRPSEWPQGVAENIFEKSAVHGREATLTLSGQGVAAADNVSTFQALGESQVYKVDSVETDGRLKPLFSNMYLRGNAGEQVKARFALSSTMVLAYRVVNLERLENLPLIDQQIAQKRGEEYLIPLFQVKIDEQGVIENKKNDLGENTNQLQIKPTNAEQATHIKFSTLESARLQVSVQSTALEEAKRVFVVKQLNNAVLNRNELREKLGVQVEREGRYFLQTSNNELKLFEVKSFNSLTSSQQALIRAQDQGTPATNLMRCSEELRRLTNDKDCVIELSYGVAIQYVQAELPRIDVSGNLSHEIVFSNLPSARNPLLAYIAKNPQPADHRDGANLDPRNLLVVKDLNNAEFFYRRTLEDSPNTVDFTFAGSAGPLELVRFQFDETRVRIVRADALLNASGSTNVDRETLVSLPAQYVRISRVDSRGQPLPTPEVRRTTHNDPEAIAVIDWTENSIPTISSPLDFYETERCFAALGERTVSEVDHRLAKDGVLNFTLNSTYAANNNSFDCAGIRNAGYFDTVQKNFSFKERISFKRHRLLSDNRVEVPELDVPYEAQKALGFGLFTYTRKVPNANNQTGVEGTQINMPSVFDIKGKQVTYILAGLPQGKDKQSTEIRKAITESTRKVITHINEAFRAALKGTAQERKDDVLKLLVEGVDVPVGQKLGDLDKNYIYYVEKPTSSGVIGLGGSHANPRSGKVESASVFMYGGNMLGMVESLRKLAKAKEQYEQIMLSKGPGENHENPSPEMRMAVGEVVPGATSSKPLGSKPSDRKVISSREIQRLRGSAVASLDDRAQLRTKLPKLNRRDQTMLRTLEGIQRLKVAQDANKIAELFAHNHRHDNELSAKDLEQSPSARLRRAGYCIYGKDLSSLVAGSSLTDNYDIQSKSDVEVLADVWAPTLAHELGHNLGLRHNFEASFDKANHSFSKSDSSKRDYSSVMDYLNNDHVTYDGLGPYDVHALRAAYAGLVELNPAVLPLVGKSPQGKAQLSLPSGGQIEVVGKNFVKITDVPAALGLRSWLDLSREQTASVLPLKTYAFCSDEEAGTNPRCNRFDTGTTPEELVDFRIRDYRYGYSLRNFPNNRLEFTYYSTGAYLAKLFQNFVSIRQILEEYVWMARSGNASEAEMNAYQQGLVKGLFFLTQVVRTPEASSFAGPDERFMKVATDTGDVTVETKWVKDRFVDANSERLSTRGVEFDKVVALMMLTSRQSSSARYDLANIELAFADLVRDEASPLSVSRLLKEVLMDNVTPLAAGPHEFEPLDSDTATLRYIPVPGQTKVEVTDLMRIYTLLGAVADLDVQGLQSTDNPAAAFRMMARFKTPDGFPYLQLQGAPNDLRYFAYPEANHATELVLRGAAVQALSKANAWLVPLLRKWYYAEFAGDEELAQKLPVRAELTEALKKLAPSIGDQNIDQILAVTKQVIDIAKDFQTIIDSQPSLEGSPQLAAASESIRLQLTALFKEAPIVGVSLQALVSGPAQSDPATADELDKLLPLAGLRTIVPQAVLESQEAVILRNAQLMSQIFLSLHPEYARE